MNAHNLDVLSNIIAAVESGNQVYGRKKYDAYDPPYKNTPNEVTITIGWYQAFGHEARQLIQAIFDADKANFLRLDTANIDDMLAYDWEKIKWNPNSKEKAVLIALIDSNVGHKVQDELFSQKMEKLIADCSLDYTEDVFAQMMYCEIRHLGGKSAVNRIFKRCNGNYSLDTIMAALKKDQSDTSSSNQVGDSKFWSRHLKCKEFIEKYAEKEVKNMPVLIGSARGDEYGGSGWDGNAKAGDQKQTKTPDYSGEVSFQNWYLHSKGWTLIRAKSAEAREKIAQDMEWAVNSKFIGYDQSQNRTLYDVVKPLGFNCSKVKTYCETDCAQLVRVCVRYAGIDCGDFYTANEVAALKKTGKFDIYTDSMYCKSSDYLLRGDILVTGNPINVKGHTVVVLSNGAKASQTVPDASGDKTEDQTQITVLPADEFDREIAGAYMVTTGLNLRRGAGGNYKIITVLPQGAVVKNYGYYTNVGSVKWLLVKYGDRTGFCSSKYLKKV